MKRFKWCLKGHYCVSSAALEKVDTPDTVDLTMNRFGPEQAERITLDILEQNKQNTLAEQLKNKHKRGNMLLLKLSC